MKQKLNANEKALARYLRVVRRHLALPKQIKDRVIADLRCSIEERREAGQSDRQILSALGDARQVAAEWNEQLRAQSYRKSPWRFLPLVVAIVSALCVVATLTDQLISRFGARSVGIIGGADGPTAIFVTTTTTGSDWVELALALVLLAAGAFAYFRLRRLPPKD